MFSTPKNSNTTLEIPVGKSKPPEPIPGRLRLDYLDSLRGFAILGVICFHCAILAGGNVLGQMYASATSYGVQLFFMVSAYTIFLTLDRAKLREKHLSRNFFIRRFFRILPMFWVGIVLYSFVPMREQTTPPIIVTVWDYLLTALCLHGFHPFSLNSVVPGGWTIAVEATFYWFAPLLFRLITNWQRALTFLWLTLLVLKMAYFGVYYVYYHGLMWQAVSPTIFSVFTDRWFPSQLPVFACGILVYFLSRSLAPQFLTKRTGVLLVVSSAILLQGSVGIGGHGFIPLPEPLWFCAGFIFLFLGLKCHHLYLLVNPFTQLMGRISYSGYLLHFWFLLISLKISHHLFPNLISHPTLQFALLFVTTVAFTIPASWFTFKFVETPFIKLGSRLVKYSEGPPQAG